jgi:hypothetical protein
MRYKEFRENYATNHHMGLGSERQQDQRIIELGDNKPHLLGKLEKTGQVVRIVKQAKQVQFSDEPNWILVDFDLSEQGKEFKWLPAATRFVWVREFGRDQQIMEKPRTRKRERKLRDNIGYTLGHGPAAGQWGNSGAKFKQM